MSEDPEFNRIPVIIDTDPGVDDVCAILLALASPELEVLAITITFGNTDVEHSYVNILKIWQVLQKHFAKHPEDSRRFPIFAPDFKGNFPILSRGSEGPLGGELHTAEYFHGRDGLANISVRHPELSIPQDWVPLQLQLTDQNAIDVSLDLIKQHPARSITYIALGPLTNLARMMQSDAALVRGKIGRVVAMGGALEASGNVTPAAEFNFYADPFAVRELLHSPDTSRRLPLNRFLLLPLDITNKHLLKFPEYRRVVDPAFGTTVFPSRPENKSPLVHFVSSFLEQTAEIMRKFGQDALQLHDPLAVWCAIQNPPIVDEASEGPLLSDGWRRQMRRFQVERTGELTRGMLVVDRRRDVENFHPGDNRAQVQAERNSKHRKPAEEADLIDHRDELLGGVAVVTDTPGSDALVHAMLSRIWGLQV